MDKDKLVMLGAAGAGVGLLYWWLTRVPPGKHRLTVRALADDTGVPADVAVDTTGLTTPGHLDLDPGAYTITAPDEIEVAGEIYEYNTYEVT